MLFFIGHVVQESEAIEDRRNGLKLPLALGRRLARLLPSRRYGGCYLAAVEGDHSFPPPRRCFGRACHNFHRRRPVGRISAGVLPSAASELTKPIRAYRSLRLVFAVSDLLAERLMGVRELAKAAVQPVAKQHVVRVGEVEGFAVDVEGGVQALAHEDLSRDLPQACLL